MRAWLLLIAAISTEVSASLSLKGALFHPWLYAVVVVGYVLAFYCLYRVLKAGMSIGVAYSIWGAVGVVATAGLSHLLFGETITQTMMTGMALIIVGVVCIEMGAPVSATPANPPAASPDPANPTADNRALALEGR